MTVTVTLGCYALLLAIGVPRLLGGAAWTRRAPRLAIGLWQAAAASLIGAVLLAALALTVSAARVSGGLARLLHLCEVVLRDHYGPLAQPAGALLGAGVAASLLTWLLAHLAVAYVAGRRLHRAHVDTLTLVARRDAALGVHVLDHDRPAAYCLPSRRGPIVLTRAALELLTPAQLAAVLAHERAHLAGHHHRVLGVARTLDRAFGFVPLFRRAATELAQLVELAADDAAAGRQDRRSVAAALATVAGGPVPGAALAAGSVCATQRVRRMLAAPAPLPRSARLACGVAAAALWLVPLLIATNPALLHLIDHHCALPL